MRIVAKNYAKECRLPKRADGCGKTGLVIGGRIMKKCFALLLALAMLPVFGISAAGESALASAGADELSSLQPGRYILYYKFDGMGSLSSYQDVSIDAQDEMPMAFYHIPKQTTSGTGTGT
jgi:hypothetical protein